MLRPQSLGNVGFGWEGRKPRTSRGLEQACSKDRECIARRTQWRLINFLRLRDALIDRLPSSKALLQSVPVGDRFLPKLPAQKNGLSLDVARKIEEADIE